MFEKIQKFWEDLKVEDSKIVSKDYSKPMIKSLYRVGLHKNKKHHWWEEGCAFILAFDAKHARRIATTFAERKGFLGVCKAVSVCGKKSKERIVVIRKDHTAIQLQEAVENRTGIGVVAFCSCKETMNRDVALETYRSYAWRNWS